MRGTDFGGLAKNRRRGVLHALLAFAVSVLVAVQAGDSRAQQSAGGAIQQLTGLSNITPDQMRDLFNGQGLGGMSATTLPQTTILEPTAPSNPALPSSRLEEIMSARAGVRLKQFGYEQMGVGMPVALPEVGGLQDDYVLGPGDEIDVTLRGQDNSQYQVMVDRDGNVVLPRISPVPAAGRRFGDFRSQLLAAIHNAYTATEAYVSVGTLRQINVMVAGEIANPGVRTLTGLSTPIDAILVSGGIKKTGSLRNVKLIHQGKTITIDLYAYLTTGVAPRNITLADGDRIVVPPLGRVVAAAGWLRRPGIYEMPPGQSALSVRSLTDLAGGVELRGSYRLALLRIEDDGQTELVPVTTDDEAVRDGEILMAVPGADQVVDRAMLAGGTPLAGSYSIKNGTRLSDVLKAPGALGVSPYTVFGIISRRDPRTYLRTLIAFSPIAALSGEFDPTLVSGDIVRVFSMRESRMLSQSLMIFAAQKQREEELTRNPYLASNNALPDGASANSQIEAVQAANAQQGITYTGPGGGIVNSPSASLPPAGMEKSLLESGNMPEGLASQNPGYSPSVPSNEQADPISAGVPNMSDAQSNPELANTLQRYQANAAPSGEAASLPEPTGMMQSPSLAPNFEEQTAPVGSTPLNLEVTTLSQLADQLDVDPVVLLNFLADHQVTLDGAVRGPGSYVIGPGINLHDLVMVAGGTVGWADRSGVELISTDINQESGSAITIRKNLPLSETTLADYIVKPRDEFRFREVFADTGLGSVTLEGEVRFPGTYQIIRGEHLLDLLKRAGGLTDVAYPYGTIYLRRSVAALEEDEFRRSANELEDQLLAAMGRSTTSTRADPTAFVAAQSLVQTLRKQKGLGRISVTADPVILSTKPNQDPLLEPGDVVYIPQRPSTISVLGEVLQPGTYTYKASLTAEDYLDKAGGFSQFADDSLTYIILPDGSAEKLDRSWLPSAGQTLPPGSVIVVPRDIAPFSWQDFAINASQIFSQLAIAGASLAVLSTNIK